MDPYFVRDLFGIQGLDIRWYAVIICVGICAGLGTLFSLGQKGGYTTGKPIGLLLVCIPLAIICARLYYVAFEWDSYKDDLWSVFAIWEGGIAIYGAVIGSVIGGFLFSKYSKISFGDILDIGGPGLIIGQAIGRWGNFVNQEAFGNLITNEALQWFPYGVYIDKLGEWHQATFFYESMWNLIVFVVLLWYFKRAKHKGNVFVMYLVLYGVGRAFIEGLRTDSLWLIKDVVRVSQALSLLLVVAGIIYLLYMHKKEPQAYAAYEGKYSIAYREMQKELKMQKKEAQEEKISGEQPMQPEDKEEK